MKKWLFVFLVIGGIYYFKPDLFSSQKGAFDEQGNPVVFLFTHDKCGEPCNAAISLLEKRHVKYQLYSINDNAANMALWKETSGVNNFPNMVVGKNNVIGSHKGRMVSALAVNLGDAVLSPSERFYMKSHFYDNGSPRLVLYGATWCVFCKELRRVLDEEAVDYVNIDVDKSEYEKSIVETIDVNGYPLVYYGYNRLDKTAPKDVLATIGK